MIEGGLARVNPVPTTVQPAREKAFTTCRPRRPVAPVTRTVLGIVVVLWDVVGSSRELFQCRDSR
jgi:hypothetical protein